MRLPAAIEAEHRDVEEVPTGPRLTSLGIENFKGVGERIDIELRPITLLFGPNSAGKSTLLHALHYAREILGRRNLDADQLAAGGRLLDLGGFKNLIHGHDVTDREVGLSLSLDVGRAEWPDYGDPAMGVPAYSDFGAPEDLVGRISAATINMQIAWSELRAEPYVKGYTTVLDGEVFGALHRDPAKPESTAFLHFDHHSLTVGEYGEASDAYPSGWTGIAEIWQAGAQAGFFPDELNDLLSLNHVRDALPIWGRPLPLNAGLPTDDADLRRFAFEVERMSGLLSRLIVGPGEMARNVLKEMRYLGPLRQTPPRFFRAPRFHDANRWADGLAAWDELASGDEQLIESVNDWLARDDRLNTGYRIAYRRVKEIPLDRVETLEYLLGDLPETLAGVAEIVRRSMIEELRGAPVVNHLMLLDIAREIDVEPHDVGVGIAQLVPVVVSALSGRGVLNVIEQPELHVHPRLQAELGDLFIEASRARDQRFIIETHSEHLILRLLRRIRETGKGSPHRGMAITPDDIAVYYVAAEGTQTTVRRIDIDMRGEFVQPWPDDFFEIDFHERFG